MTVKKWALSLVLVCCSIDTALPVFSTIVKYPSRDNFFKQKSKKVELADDGEIYVEQEDGLTKEFGSSYALSSWFNVLADRSTKKMVEVLVTQSGLHLRGQNIKTPFGRMVLVVENLSFLAEMKALRKIFFGPGPLVDWDNFEERKRPIILESSKEKDLKELGLILELARSYWNVGRIMEGMGSESCEQGTAFGSSPVAEKKEPLKDYLGTWGAMVMYRRSLEFYKKYLDKSDPIDRLALGIFDPAMIRYILARPPELLPLLRLVEEDKKFFGNAVVNIESGFPEIQPGQPCHQDYCNMVNDGVSLAEPVQQRSGKIEGNNAGTPDPVQSPGSAALKKSWLPHALQTFFGLALGR